MKWMRYIRLSTVIKEQQQHIVHAECRLIRIFWISCRLVLISAKCWRRSWIQSPKTKTKSIIRIEKRFLDIFLILIFYESCCEQKESCKMSFWIACYWTLMLIVIILLSFIFCCCAFFLLFLSICCRKNWILFLTTIFFLLLLTAN